MGLHNMTSRNVTLSAKTIVAKLCAANAVPNMLAPHYADSENENGEADGCSDSLQMPQPPAELGEGEKVAAATSHNSPIDKEPEIARPALTDEQRTKLFEKLDMHGIEHWSSKNQQEAHNIAIEYGFLFALNNLDLGKTSIVKHEIKLPDYTPFKERYHRIPPPPV